jgi:hypothetical protein
LYLCAFMTLYESTYFCLYKYLLIYLRRMDINMMQGYKCTLILFIFMYEVRNLEIVLWIDIWEEYVLNYIPLFYSLQLTNLFNEISLDFMNIVYMHMNEHKSKCRYTNICILNSFYFLFHSQFSIFVLCFWASMYPLYKITT